ncbi:endonuclease/exonuclease/phosphatase family protein [Arcobacter sp. CECT 8985]|uniref:endonuclease/exonuclease/phosphatase family protein n=1 Tax=Arcobacter sp. CECT 8985 TaxID=1935424 RepID=UPI00100AFF81|nr:endonuclease/exonuclease/phosphatase family protein [Arcobacter sp. CECT 8985]RXJ88206.1 endonuclease [Arcobacter sp. CECT 8985]
MNIKVGTFNLFQFVEPPYSWYIKKDKFSQEEWIKKTSWIKEQLKLMNCDVVGFQEVFSQDALKELTKQLGYEYFYCVDTAKVSDQNKNVYISTTVALASKYPIVNIDTLTINNEILNLFEKDNFEFSRLPIKATIKVKNKKIITYVFHLKSNRLNEYEYKFNENNTIEEKLNKIIPSLNRGNSQALEQRLMEAYHICFDVLKTIKKNKNIILIGDLNDRQNSLCIDVLTNKACLNINSFKKVNQYNLKEDFIMYDSYEKAETKSKREPTSFYKTIGNILDYIFVSKDIKVTKFEQFNTHLKDNKDGSLLQSDHAQIVSTILLN